MASDDGIMAASPMPGPGEMPLTCDGCKHAQAAVLAVLHAGPRPAGSLRVMQLLCTECAAKWRQICERGERPVTFLVITAAVRPLVFDLATPRLGWVLTEALDMWAAAQREKAAFEGGNAQREAWAQVADQARAQVEAHGV